MSSVSSPSCSSARWPPIIGNALAVRLVSSPVLRIQPADSLRFSILMALQLYLGACKVFVFALYYSCVEEAFHWTATTTISTCTINISAVTTAAIGIGSTGVGGGFGSGGMGGVVAAVAVAAAASAAVAAGPFTP